MAIWDQGKELDMEIYDLFLFSRDIDVEKINNLRGNF